MEFVVPPDLEVLVQKRLASGRFANTEEVFRHALETLDAEESWTDEDRHNLNARIDHALEQVRLGKVYSPEEARRKLDALKEARMAGAGR